MRHDRHIAREISYASSAQSQAGRRVIRVLENATGRLGLIGRASGYEQDLTAGRGFWDVMAGRYGLSTELVGGALENIPTDGPVVVVANHPYGILDGLILGQLLGRRRSEYRILANQVFCRAKDLEKVILPVDFEESREAVQQNISTRKESLRFLTAGGAIGVFPGGTVSTSLKPFGHPMDPGWRRFTARLIAKSEAVVVPVFFEGHNSRLFQVASRLHTNLRLGLLINEFRARVDTSVRLVIGEPLNSVQLDPYRGDPKSMMDFLRKATYQLSPKPLSDLGYGFEFENRHKN